MSEENDLFLKYAIELRTKLYSTVANFWVENKKNNQEITFYATSTAVASVIAQLTIKFMKNDTPDEELNDYIDTICKDAKSQLQIAKELLVTHKSGMN